MKICLSWFKRKKVEKMSRKIHFHRTYITKTRLFNILKISSPKTESFQIKILIFSSFRSKYRVWVLIRTASAVLTSTHNPCIRKIIHFVICSSSLLSITKTYLYNFDPLKPHFYVVKLGFTGVNIIFLISAQKHRLYLSSFSGLSLL